MARRLKKIVEHRSFLGDSPARSLIPIGMVTLLPDTAQRVRELEGLLLDCFGKWGYREIIPPIFEYLDILSSGLPSEVLEKCYKFADWSTGRILVLRPDVTAQIARIVGMGMAGQGMPLRLSYRTTVFRYEPEHAGREREVFQVGVELIGADTASMDAEILTLLIEALKVIGVTGFKISLGHVGFYQALLAKSNLSEEGRKQAEIAAAHKDMPKLESILKRESVHKDVARMILEIPGRYGRDDVLSWGRKISGRDRRLLQPLDRLERVYHFLEHAGLKEYLLLDLGEFRGFDYYDGLVFDVFCDGIGCELGGGGRYNHLIGRFGRDLPSTGFALDVDRLFGVLEGGGHSQLLKKPMLLVSPRRLYGKAFQVVQTLRSAGFSLVHETVELSVLNQPETFQCRARDQGLSFIIGMGAKNVMATHVLLLMFMPGCSTPRKRTIAIVDLVAVLQDILREARV